MGDLEAAWAWMQRALRQVESVRTRLLNRDLRTSYLATKQRYYEFSIDLLMELHQGHRAMGFDAKALSISERARARALLDLLQESEVEINGQTPLSLLTRERELGRAIRESREALDRVGGAASETSAATTRKELRGLLRDYETAKAEVRRASPRSRASLVAPPLSSGEIQHRVLDEKTLLLQYELGDERSFLWTVSPDSFVSFVLPARDEIENLARQAHELLSSRDQRKWEGKRQATLHRLSEILLAPVANHLGESRLLIVADGALLLLPFGALPDPLAEPLIRDNLDYPVPLLVHHEVVTLPSASSAAMLEQRSSARSPAPELLAIVADPVFDREDSRVHASPLLMATASVATPWSSGTFQRLSYSREEALGIAAEAIERPFLALDFDANRQAIVREGFDRYRILHLATHGEIDTEYPLLSRLVLSLVDDSGRPLDGYLYAHEIYELHLPAELVVLSACETALGKEIQGEGLVGLPHAFLYAGANRVVVSLWKVHDRSTADLMVRFYRHLLSGGESPVSALRAAQIESWERAPWNHGWAAFVFQGLWSWDDSKPKSRSRAPTL
jgi:CHAT domain-containing protein